MKIYVTADGVLKINNSAYPSGSLGYNFNDSETLVIIYDKSNDMNKIVNTEIITNIFSDKAETTTYADADALESVLATFFKKSSSTGTVIDNETIVNSESDLPAPFDAGGGDGFGYNLENTAYLIGAPLTLDYPLIITGCKTSIISNILTSITFTQTSGACIKGSNVIYFSNKNIELNIDTGASLFDINTIRVLNFDYGRFAGVGGLGQITNPSTAVFNRYLFLNFNSKFIIEGGSASNIVLFADSAFSPGSFISTELIEIKGMFLSFGFSNIQSIPVAGASAFNIDAGTIAGNLFFNTVDVITAYFGIPFKSGSLTQTSIFITAKNVFGFPESQTVGSCYMERNLTETVISVVGKTDNYTAVSGSIFNPPSTITSAGHGLTNGETVWIVDDSEHYTGKYTISNVTVNTFEIAHDFFGTSTGSWETGWVKFAGTSIALEEEGAIMSNDNELTFLNKEKQAALLVLPYNPENPVTVTNEVEFCVMKNDLRILGSLRFRELTKKAGEGFMSVTTTVENGDVFVPYCRNIENTDNIILRNITFTIKV